MSVAKCPYDCFTILGQNPPKQYPVKNPPRHFIRHERVFLTNPPTGQNPHQPPPPPHQTPLDKTPLPPTEKT